MKAIRIFLVLASLTFPGSHSFAQSNLQFNRAIFVQITQTTSSPSYVDSTVVVPAGKVWKIESAGTGSPGMVINIGNIGFSSLNGQIVNPSSGYNVKNLPIWLPSGTYYIRMANGGVGYNGFVSGIEFNLTP